MFRWGKIVEKSKMPRIDIALTRLHSPKEMRVLGLAWLIMNSANGMSNSAVLYLRLGEQMSELAAGRNKDIHGV